MTPFQSSQPGSQSNHSSKKLPIAPLQASLGGLSRLYQLLWQPLGLGLAGMSLVGVPIAQAQTTGAEIKLLEPAGLAAVQPTSSGPSSSPSSEAISKANDPTPSIPQVAAPEISDSEIEPMPPIVEKPSPQPVAPIAKAPTLPAKPAVIARPEIVEPQPVSVQSQEDVAPELEPEALNWGPVTVDRQGIQFSAPAALKPYFSGNLKLPKMPNLSSLGMMFPLSIPSPISSLFGWRVHPITGEQRVHTGTDIAAPLGTPVLAALTGKVLLADFLGGYGMVVALEHGQGSQQTLYAHLSELFVKPGQVVQKGTVIGRVGSTGNSTGPHLHFEMRQQLPDGSWIAVDAGQQLEVAMKDLNQALKVAQKPQVPTLQGAQLSAVPQVVQVPASPAIPLKASNTVRSKTAPAAVIQSKAVGAQSMLPKAQR